MDIRPIGIFDSGSGGLSIWQSLVRMQPHESTVYIGDHNNIPYSTKTKTFIQTRAIQGIQFLISKNVKLIIIACNTATVASIDTCRCRFPGIPIVGVVPVVKTAAKKSKSKHIVVLSTLYTAKSQYQKTLIATFAPECIVHSVGNTELVMRIESGETDTAYIQKTLRFLLIPPVKSGADVIALGCTHFPFLRTEIEKIVGKEVSVLDSGDAVCRRVGYILEKESLLSQNIRPSYLFYTTGDAQKVCVSCSQLLQTRVVVKHCSI